MTMKKSIFISLCMVMAATAVLTSCKKDNDTVSFRATISTYQNNGKVYIDNNRFANWIDEDEVLINGAPYTVEVGVSGDDRIASINGVRAVEEGGYYAIYPSECALTTPTSGFPQILLPQVQLYRNDNPANPAQGNQIVEAPMAAYCSADREQAGLDFTNLCALLKVELDEPMEVGYITVSSSNKPLWGRASISINSTTNLPTISSPEIASLYATDNTVTLDCTTPGLHHSASGASEGVTSAGPFYIVLPPATNVADLTINIYVFTGDASGQTRRTILKYAKTTTNTNTITIASNNLYVTGDLPDQGVEVPDVPFPYLSTGEFSVSRTQTGGPWYNPTYSYKKVRFSLANLQYNTVDGIWRFAPNQWTSLIANQGSQNWIDLFGYGTSGVNYSPTLTSQSNSDYASGDIQNTENDWGVNAISNGGNQPNKWRTLTMRELHFLFNLRPHSNDLHHTNCTVRGVKGMIVLPDDFPYNDSRYNYFSDWDWQRMTAAQWQEVEAMGAIFIPNSGQRNGTTVSNTSNGYYWTSAQGSYGTSSGYRLTFESDGEGYDSPNQYMGSAVRLVRDVN